MGQQGDQIGQFDVGRRGRRQRRGQERRHRHRWTGGRPGAGQRGRIEAERPGGAQLARLMTLRASKGCNGCRTRTRSRTGSAVAGPRGVVQGIQQFTQRHGRRPPGAGAFVGAGVGDDQMLGRRQDRVQHQLPILAARIPFADGRITGDDVVAVDAAAAREDPVVQAEQADHPVRHRPHRHHGADGQRAGAEVRAGGSAAEPTAQQRAEIGQRQAPCVRPGFRAPSRTKAISVRSCADCHSSPVGTLVRLVTPVISASSHPVSGCADERVDSAVASRSTSSANLPASSTSELPTSSSGRARSSQFWSSSLIVTPSSSRSRPLRQVFWANRCRPKLPRPRGIDTPADARVGHPGGQLLQIVVVEPETAADRREGGQVEHLGGGHPAVGQLQQPGHRGQQRVGLGQRAIGQPDPQTVRRMTTLDHVDQAERRRDQRRVHLDVRAHHQHVARFQRVVGGQQPDQHLPQHVDLSGGTVTGMHLHAVVAWREQEAIVVCGQLTVVPETLLQGAEQRAGRTVDRQVLVHHARHVRQHQLQFPGVPAQRRQQCMLGDGCRRVESAAERQRRRGLRDPVPQHRRGMGQPQVHVAAFGERFEHLQLADRQPGDAEQREPLRQIDSVGIGGQGGEGCGASGDRVAVFRGLLGR